MNNKLILLTALSTIGLVTNGSDARLTTRERSGSASSDDSASSVTADSPDAVRGDLLQVLCDTSRRLESPVCTTLQDARKIAKVAFDKPSLQHIRRDMRPVTELLNRSIEHANHEKIQEIAKLELTKAFDDAVVITSDVLSKKDLITIYASALAQNRANPEIEYSVILKNTTVAYMESTNLI